MMSRSNPKQQMSESLNVGFSHSRSSSQPTFFTNNCLPPLSPVPPSESSMVSSNSNLKDVVSMEEIDVSSQGPPRRRHFRSNSDVPLGFSAMIMSSPQLVPISSQGTLPRAEASGTDNKLKKREMDYGGMCDVKSEGEVVDEMFNSWMNLDDIRADKDKLNASIGGENSKSREGVKRSATGDIAPPARHYRSLSMDSALGKFHSDDESAKLSNSFKDNSAQLNLDFGYGEFNDVELKKIMGDERLAEIAVTDPKRAKRILANRQSAARSKERKMRYISELELKVQTLQKETTTLTNQVTFQQKEYGELTNQNNELKFRVQALEKQAQIRDALHEALTAEVQRLRFENMELRDEGRTSNGIHNLFQIQHQQLSVSESTTLD